MVRAVSLMTCLSGCFLSAGVSYSPSSTISVQRSGAPDPVVIEDSTATLNVRLGVNFDLGGVGVHYAWYAARALRNAEGLPHEPNISGTHTRVDVDLPLAFGPNKALVLRASYAYERFDKFNNGGGTETAGKGHHGGLTIATLNKDVSLSVLLGKYEVTSQAPMNDLVQPALGISGWDLDVGLTVRFIPSGTLVSRFVYEHSPIFTISNCGYRLAKHGGGFTCE